MLVTGQAPQTTKTTTAKKESKGAVSAFDPMGAMEAIHTSSCEKQNSWDPSNIGQASGSSKTHTSENLMQKLTSVSISN